MNDLSIVPFPYPQKVTVAISTRLLGNKSVDFIVKLVKKYPDNYIRLANYVEILVLREVPLAEVFEIITRYSLLTSNVRVSTRWAEEKSYAHNFPHEDIFVYGGI